MAARGCTRATWSGRWAADGFGPAVAKLNVGSFERAGLCKLETRAVDGDEGKVEQDNVTGIITPQTQPVATHLVFPENRTTSA